MIRLENKHPDIGNGHIFIPLFKPYSIGAGAWPYAISGAYAFNGMVESANDADNCSYLLFLARGTYTLQFFTYKHVSSPIVDFDIDGVEVGSLDTYDAGSVFNDVLTIPGIVITSPGLKTIRIRVDGKHASSGGYILRMSAVVLYRTA